MDEDIEMTENIDEHESLLNHVILPRFLPPKKQDYKDELKLADLLLKIVVELHSVLPLNTIRLCQKLNKIHLQSTDDNLNETISNELKSLRADDTFAMFVRHQNCTLIIHKKPQKLILATFHSDVNPHEVYSHDGDIEVIIYSFITSSRKEKVKQSTH